MDVRCERCRVQYVVPDARVSEAGIKVACAQCGHAFLLRKKTLAVTVPLKGGDPDVPTPIGALVASGEGEAHAGADGVERSQWRLRQPGGAVFPFRELSTLQRWIVERKASQDDEVAAAGEGEAWRRLGEIPELQSFFALLARAQRKREPSQEAPAEGAPETARARPGLEDPAWASGPVPPTRRTTRSALRAPPPRRRVVWVALLVLGLLGVAAGTVYLRSKADADAAAQAASADLAAAALAATKASGAVAPPVEAEARPAPVPGPPREQRVIPETPPSSDVAAAPGTVEAPAPPALSPVATTQAEQAPTGSAASPPAAPPAVDPAPAPAAVAGIRPSPRDDTPAAVRSLMVRAREQRDRGRCEAALDLYGQALALDGRNAAALAGRGACYLDLSRYVQAEASFEGALESDPRNAEALHGMAETYRYMGRKDDAVAFYERFLAVRPTGDEAVAARRLISQLKE